LHSKLFTEVMFLSLNVNANAVIGLCLQEPAESGPGTDS
jgi:hypothetical protein